MSPIIATLLLIAIAVASGILVYVFTGTLAGNLTKSGGSQVTEQISMDAYNFQGSTLTVYLRNTGTSSANLTSIYFNGVPVTTFTFTASAGCLPASSAVYNNCPAGGTTALAFTPSPAPSSGTSNSVKIVTANGAQFTYSVVAGQTG